MCIPKCNSRVGATMLVVRFPRRRLYKPLLRYMGWALLWGCFAAGCLWSGLAEAQQQLQIKQQDDQVVLSEAGRVVLVYQASPAPYKPYVKQWLTPGGLQVLEDSPPDHVHHHGLMLAVGVNDVDFWSEIHVPKPGRQVPRGRTTVSCKTTTQNGRTTSQATIEQTIDWKDFEGTPLLEERRTITWQRVPGLDASMILWTSRLIPAKGQQQVELWGRRYFGLGTRIGPTGPQPAEFVNSTGKPGKPVRGREGLVRADWCACRGVIEGKKFTLAVFDHPNNPRSPATFFTMNRPFAYLSATLALKAEPLKLSAERPITLRYGLVLWDGHVDKQQIARAARLWQESLEPAESGDK